MVNTPFQLFLYVFLDRIPYSLGCPLKIFVTKDAFELLVPPECLQLPSTGMIFTTLTLVFMWSWTEAQGFIQARKPSTDLTFQPHILISKSEICQTSK